MGWASGSELAGNVWALMRPLTTDGNRKETASKLMKLFVEHDCDTLYEAEQLYRDAEIKEEE